MLSAYTGTSDGGMAAQVYVQKYPGETGELVLISTGGLAKVIIPYCKRKIIIDDQLLLKGLMIIYNKNR